MALVRFTWSWATEMNLAIMTMRELLAAAGMDAGRPSWGTSQVCDLRPGNCDPVSPLLSVIRHILPGAETGITELR